jgi:hypothetical protein
VSNEWKDHKDWLKGLKFLVQMASKKQFWAIMSGTISASLDRRYRDDKIETNAPFIVDITIIIIIICHCQED